MMRKEGRDNCIVDGAYLIAPSCLVFDPQH